MVSHPGPFSCWHEAAWATRNNPTPLSAAVGLHRGAWQLSLGARFGTLRTPSRKSSQSSKSAKRSVHSVEVDKRRAAPCGVQGPDFMTLTNIHNPRCMSNKHMHDPRCMRTSSKEHAQQFPLLARARAARWQAPRSGHSTQPVPANAGHTASDAPSHG